MKTHLLCQPPSSNALVSPSAFHKLGIKYMDICHHLESLGYLKIETLISLYE